jgi:hypothetical protein
MMLLSDCFGARARGNGAACTQGKDAGDIYPPTTKPADMQKFLDALVQIVNHLYMNFS